MEQKQTWKQRHLFIGMEEGVRNSMPMDQFREQTYILYRKSKGGLVGLMLSLPIMWLAEFCHTLSARVTHAFNSMYQVEKEKSASTTRHIHKEEGTKLRKPDIDDRKLRADTLSKHSHPLQTVN